MAAALFRLVTNMVFKTPSVRAETLAETTPTVAAFPVATIA
jgi:hypothetical protein